MNSLIALINALTAPVSLSALKSVLLPMAAGIRPYKVISGLFSQVATDDPTAIILENNTGATPTFTRLDVGVYAITATGLFEEDKTWCIISESDANIERNSDNQVRIFGADDLLLNTSFEIRIYE
jgi:hypothetical protein